MIEVNESFYIILQVLFVVLSFSTLYFWRKSNKLGNIKIDDKIIKKTLSELPKKDSSYLTLLNTYGSIEAYEDARMKDFDIMRGQLKNVSIFLENTKALLLEESDKIRHLFKNKINKEVVDYTCGVFNELLTYTETSKKILDGFIEKEEEAHTKTHTEEIKEGIERSKNEKF